MNVIQSPTPLAGRKVYSAGVIATYTALTNIPTGCILYGLNLQARGSRNLGRIVVAAGSAGAVGLCLAYLFAPSSSRSLALIGILAAICFYKFEKAPVATAVRDGATLARWWLPALWLVGALGVLFGIACVLL